MAVGKIAVVTTNLGSFERQKPHVVQSTACDLFNITDEQFPPRFNSMTPRLQARIVKTHMWDFAPGYDYYIWIDSSCIMSHNSTINWFLEKLGDSDIAVFKHPHRQTVAEEAAYLEQRLGKGCPYITPRYEGELIAEQLEVVDSGMQLFASTAFVCRPTGRVKRAMRDWWYHISRYHSIDQFSLPHVLWDNECRVSVIEDNYLKTPYIEYVRNK